ncbi:MAG: tetratricopeptide repeat protein [Pseudomonadota bacterium]
MYGYDAPKTNAQLAADAEFMEKARDSSDGSLEASTLKAIALGWTYFGRGDLATSMKRFNQAYLLDPAHGEAYAGMAVVVLQRGGSTDEAYGLFQRAISSPILTYTVHRNYGLFLMRQNRYLDALAQFDAALELDPEIYGLRFMRAGLLDELGRADESRQEIQRACEGANRSGNYVGRPETDMPRATCAEVGVPLD